MKKPIVAWCIGTCAQELARQGSERGPMGDTTADSLDEVQFGHAGACARSEEETAVWKNARLAKAGIHVPPSFNELGNLIRSVSRFFSLLPSSSGTCEEAAGR